MLTNKDLIDILIQYPQDAEVVHLIYETRPDLISYNKEENMIIIG